jgi:hypothetical protein
MADGRDDRDERAVQAEREVARIGGQPVALDSRHHDERCTVLHEVLFGDYAKLGAIDRGEGRTAFPLLEQQAVVNRSFLDRSWDWADFVRWHGPAKVGVHSTSLAEPPATVDPPAFLSTGGAVRFEVQMDPGLGPVCTDVRGWRNTQGYIDRERARSAAGTDGALVVRRA